MRVKLLKEREITKEPRYRLPGLFFICGVSEIYFDSSKSTEFGTAIPVSFLLKHLQPRKRFNKRLNRRHNNLVARRLFLSMANRRLIAVFLLMPVCHSLCAQEKVSGKIYSRTNDSVVIAATIRNKSLKLLAYSGSDGSYHIFADEGDTLIFSATGYIADTVTVRLYMLLTPYDVTLDRKVITLEMARVTSSYSQDSLNRRIYYADIFKKQPGITGFNTPAYGAGIVFSPISYFSKAAKRKRVLKKRLLQQDRDDYIDRSFPVEWVKRLTGLKGDSLNLFMYRYRPSYDFCRKTDQQGMILYINDKLKEFRKPKSSE